MNYNIKITDYINKANQEHAAVLEDLRALIHGTVANVSEEIKWGFPVFNNGKDFTYFRSTKKHVTLGFINAEKLKDPNNLLEGEGNTMRHIKITQLDAGLKKTISNWLKQAST